MLYGESCKSSCTQYRMMQIMQQVQRLARGDGPQITQESVDGFLRVDRKRAVLRQRKCFITQAEQAVSRNDMQVLER